MKTEIKRGSTSGGTTRGNLKHIHQYSQYFEDIFLENKVKQRIITIYLYILKYLLRLFTKKWLFLHKKSNFIFSNENIRLFYFKLRITLYKQYLEKSDCPWSLRWGNYPNTRRTQKRLGYLSPKEYLKKIS